MDLGTYRYNLLYILILVIVFVLETIPVKAAGSSKRKSPMAGSDSNRSGKKFGCPLEYKKKYKGNSGPVKPIWADDDVPPLILNNKEYDDLEKRLYEINRNLIESQNYNTVDKFIRFYDAYTRQKKSLRDFFLSYELNLQSETSLNIDILEEIIKDEEIKRKFPTISENIFLASTFEANEELVHKLLNPEDSDTDDPDADISFNIKYDDSIIHSMNHFKHATAVIKIAYTRSIRSPYDDYFEVANRTGFILLNPESDWKNSMTVMQDFPNSPHSGFRGITYKIAPNDGSRVKKEWMCPEVKYAGIVDVTEVSFDPMFARYKDNYIYPHTYVDDRKVICTDGNIIYIGKPYCSVVETTEKFKLLSPYRSLIKREKDEREAMAGIFSVIDTSFNSEFVLFNPMPSAPPYYKITEHIEYQSIEVISSNSKNAPKVSSKKLMIGDKEVNYNIVREDLLKRLTDVGLVLNIHVEELINKIKTIHKIIKNSNFMSQLQEMRDNVHRI